MRRWARALPLILVGVGAVMATRTATEPAPSSGAAAAVMARAAVARPAAPSRPASTSGTGASVKGPAVRSAATARPAAEDAAVREEAAAPAVTAPAVKSSATARPGETPPAVKSPATARPAASGARASVLQVTTGGGASASGTPRIAVEVDPGASVRRSFVVVEPERGSGARPCTSRQSTPPLRRAARCTTRRHRRRARPRPGSRSPMWSRRSSRAGSCPCRSR